MQTLNLAHQLSQQLNRSIEGQVPLMVYTFLCSELCSWKAYTVHSSFMMTQLYPRISISALRMFLICQDWWCLRALVRAGIASGRNARWGATFPSRGLVFLSTQPHHSWQTAGHKIHKWMDKVHRDAQKCLPWPWHELWQRFTGSQPSLLLSAA